MLISAYFKQLIGKYILKEIGYKMFLKNNFFQNLLIHSVQKCRGHYYKLYHATSRQVMRYDTLFPQCEEIRAFKIQNIWCSKLNSLSYNILLIRFKQANNLINTIDFLFKEMFFPVNLRYKCLHYVQFKYLYLRLTEKIPYF